MLLATGNQGTNDVAKNLQLRQLVNIANTAKHSGRVAYKEVQWFHTMMTDTSLELLHLFR